MATGRANEGLETKLAGIEGKIEMMRSTLTIWFGVQTALLGLLGVAAIWSQILK